MPVIIFSFSSCGQSRNVSSSEIITACFAEKGTGYVAYTFYVSNPTSDNDESGDDKSAKLHTVYATDFGSALKKFEEAFGRYELSHMSIFFADVGYLSEHYYNDRMKIAENIRVSPIVKFFVIDQAGETIAGFIDNSYDHSPETFVKSSWRGNRKKLLCTMSEMIFASENPMYTASVPVVSTSKENGSLVSNAVVLYNINKGAISVTGEDFSAYSEYIKINGKTSKSQKISLLEDVITVQLEADEAMKKVSQKYTSLGFDLMNIFYYSKKFFPDYTAYYNYIENIEHSNIIFR